MYYLMCVMYLLFVFSFHFRIKLPVPDAVKDMYKDDLTLQVDDSASHGGRIRTFAHERGNWASFVYIPCR